MEELEARPQREAEGQEQEGREEGVEKVPLRARAEKKKRDGHHPPNGCQMRRKAYTRRGGRRSGRVRSDRASERHHTSAEASITSRVRAWPSMIATYGAGGGGCGIGGAGGEAGGGGANGGGEAGGAHGEGGGDGGGGGVGG